MMPQSPQQRRFHFFESAIKPVIRLTSSGGGGHKAVQTSWLEAMKETFIDELNSSLSVLNHPENQALLKTAKGLYQQIESLNDKQSLSLSSFRKKLTHILQNIDEQDWPNARKDAFLEDCLKKVTYLNQMRSPDLDILMDSVSLGFIGKWLWDFSQKHEYVWIQKALLEMQSFSNYLSDHFIYACVLKRLEEKSPAYIIDTQPMGTKAIAEAVLAYNRNYKKNVRIKKYCTDMPTVRSVHFFNELKKLEDCEKKLIDLHVLPPLTPEAEKGSQLKFWQHFCGDKTELIRVTDPNINLNHLQALYEKKIPSGVRIYQLEHPNHWPIRKPFKAFKTDNDYALNRKALAKEGLKLSLDKSFNLVEAKKQGMHELEGSDLTSHAVVKIDEEDKVISLMLGSNGGASLLDYVETIKEAIKKNKPSETDRHLHLFVFCAKNQLVQDKILKRLSEDRELPKNLHVYPLGFQDGEIIANISARSQSLVTRSGGTASMEAMAVCRQAQILIHSQETISLKKIGRLLGESLEELLLAAIPVWEGGNANYLRRLFPSLTRVVNPQTILTHLDLDLSCPSCRYEL